MRFLAAVFLSVLCAFAGFAATTAGKSTSQARKAAPVAKKSTSPSGRAPGTKTAVTKSAGSKGVATKGVAAKGKKPAPAPVANWRTRQMNPSADRYKEIQQALVAKGYLKSEPTGVWDADSVGAMQRFQMDQKLTPSGKINAPSLIGLGLGAKSAGAPEAPGLPGAPGPVVNSAPAVNDSPASPASPPPVAQ